MVKYETYKIYIYSYIHIYITIKMEYKEVLQDYERGTRGAIMCIPIAVHMYIVLCTSALGMYIVHMYYVYLV